MPRYSTNKPKTTATLDQLIKTLKPYTSNRARRYYFVNFEQANIDIDDVYDIYKCLVQLKSRIDQQ